MFFTYARRNIQLLKLEECCVGTQRNTYMNRTYIVFSFQASRLENENGICFIFHRGLITDLIDIKSSLNNSLFSCVRVIWLDSDEAARTPRVYPREISFHHHKTNMYLLIIYVIIARVFFASAAPSSKLYWRIVSRDVAVLDVESIEG